MMHVCLDLHDGVMRHFCWEVAELNRKLSEERQITDDAIEEAKRQCNDKHSVETENLHLRLELTALEAKSEELRREVERLREALLKLREYGGCFCDYHSSQHSDYPQANHTPECLNAESALAAAPAKPVPTR